MFMRTFLRIIAACCVMALTGLTVFAQTDRVVISGTVKSESGDPLVGASVIVKGATTAEPSSRLTELTLFQLLKARLSFMIVSDSFPRK